VPKGTVLIIANPLEAMMVRRALEDVGVATAVVEGGEAALGRFDEEQPIAVVLAHDIYTGDAAEVLAGIRTRPGARVPVVLVSDAAWPDCNLDAEELVRRPVDPRELVARIEELLGAPLPRTETTMTLEVEPEPPVDDLTTLRMEPRDTAPMAAVPEPRADDVATVRVELRAEDLATLRIEPGTDAAGSLRFELGADELATLRMEARGEPPGDHRPPSLATNAPANGATDLLRVDEVTDPLRERPREPKAEVTVELTDAELAEAELTEAELALEAETEMVLEAEAEPEESAAAPPPGGDPLAGAPERAAAGPGEAEEAVDDRAIVDEENLVAGVQVVDEVNFVGGEQVVDEVNFVPRDLVVDEENLVGREAIVEERPMVARVVTTVERRLFPSEPADGELRITDLD
jgi:CheY-like chemotaxis protein